jgi:hypothetical protein
MQGELTARTDTSLRQKIRSWLKRGAGHGANARLVRRKMIDVMDIQREAMHEKGH